MEPCQSREIKMSTKNAQAEQAYQTSYTEALTALQQKRCEGNCKGACIGEKVKLYHLFRNGVEFLESPFATYCKQAAIRDELNGFSLQEIKV